jgi:8-oxo-dGTP pyrophosphatase MutT (NUDIX family)
MMKGSSGKKIQKYSYGVLLFTGKGEDRRYLLIQNRDTEAFIYFFLSWNMDRWTDSYMMRVLRGFSRDELNRLLFYPFDILYTDLYVNHKKGTYTKQYDRAQSNYNFFHSRKDWVRMCHTACMTTEILWGFSKGRIETGEDTRSCALRELKEETGIDPQSIALRSDMNEITYINEKSLFNTAVNVTLYPAESGTAQPIQYQEFENTIRCHSVSNEILHAQWVSIRDAVLLLPPTLYRILYEFHLRCT